MHKCVKKIVSQEKTATKYSMVDRRSPVENWSKLEIHNMNKMWITLWIRILNSVNLADLLKLSKYTEKTKGSQAHSSRRRNSIRAAEGILAIVSQEFAP